MTLTSVNFFIFVIVVLLLYFLAPKKIQWVVLLLSSYFFYIFTCNKYVLYLILTTVTTYFGARLIQRVANKASDTMTLNKEAWSRDEKKQFKTKVTRNKKLLLAGTLVINFGILAILKYYGFFADSVSSLMQNCGLSFELPDFGFVLPLGISFYTFQSMGYIIDVYRKKVVAEKNIAKLALFVSFFPQIIQGPIAFYSDLAHQLYESRKFCYEKFKSGAELIIWGFFKKLVIADRAVVLINVVTDKYGKFSGTFILLTAIVYALQLYADFSGGIDICRGVAEMLGITMAENFKRPYFSKTLTEYWHRWHITLGEWLRTYLFYPLSLSPAFLGMGKFLKKHNCKHLGKVLPTSIASLITFVVIGIWHGANWKYVAFGLWNGAVIMLAALLQPWLDKLVKKLHINKENIAYTIFAILRTFIIVLIGYYFDIAKRFTAAIKMIRLSICDFHISDFADQHAMKSLVLDKFDYGVLIFGVAVIFTASLIQEKTGKNIRDILAKRSLALQWTVLLLGLISIILAGNYGLGYNPAEFVYMQF